MPEEETSQEELEETSQEGESEETSAQEESTQETEESQEDLEAELARLRQVEADKQALDARFTQTSQENAQLRAWYEQQARQQQQQDPIAQLKKQRDEAWQTGDPSYTALQDELTRQVANQMKVEAAQAAFRAAQLGQGIGSAAEMAGGNFTLEDFQNIQQGMTPQEAAILKRHREGTLGELFKSNQQQQRQERSAAARASQSGATGRARGPKSGAPEDETSLEKFNPKKALNLRNKKAHEAYLAKCDPETVPDDWVYID